MNNTHLGIKKTCQSCIYARSAMMHDNCSWDIQNQDGPTTVFQRIKDADGNYTALFCDKWRPQAWHLEQRIKELEAQVPDWVNVAKHPIPKDKGVILAWRFYPVAVCWNHKDEEYPWDAVQLGGHLPMLNNGFSEDDQNITHWMPLPTAPTEEKE